MYLHPTSPLTPRPHPHPRYLKKGIRYYLTVPSKCDPKSKLLANAQVSTHARAQRTTLPEPGRAASHDFALAHEFGVELGAVEREVDVKVDAVEGTLGRVHALKVLLKVLPGEIGREGDDFLDACVAVSGGHVSLILRLYLRGSFVYSGHTSSSQAYRMSSYMSVAPGATCRKKETLTGSPILTRWPFCTKIWRVYLHLSLPSSDGTRYCSGW